MSDDKIIVQDWRMEKDEEPKCTLQIYGSGEYLLGIEECTVIISQLAAWVKAVKTEAGLIEDETEAEK